MSLVPALDSMEPAILATPRALEQASGTLPTLLRKLQLPTPGPSQRSKVALAKEYSPAGSPTSENEAVETLHQAAVEAPGRQLLTFQEELALISDDSSWCEDMRHSTLLSPISESEQSPDSSSESCDASAAASHPHSSDASPPFVGMDTLNSERLNFEELLVRVRSNRLEGVEFDAGVLTSSQVEQLVLRGVDISTVLAGFGLHFTSNQFRSNKKGMQTLSKPVVLIDEFLSHAWRTHRFVKTITLLYYYNYHIASIAYAIVGALAFLSTFTVGRITRCSAEPWFILASAFLSLGTPLVVFLIVFFFGTKIRRLNVFLDKLCINQSNADLKTLGINSLETFVRKSRRLVLLYDNCTYTRLWCAFESAMFAHDRDCSTTDFRVVPIALAMFQVFFQVAFMLGAVVCAVAFFFLTPHPADLWFRLCANEYLVVSSGVWANLSAPIPTLQLLSTPVFFVAGYLVLRRCEDMWKLAAVMEAFRIDSTECEVESDRDLVYARITETWGSLSKFDDFVRDELSNVVAATVGSVDDIPYGKRLVMTTPMMYLCFWVGASTPGYSLVEFLLGGLLFGFVGCPTCLLWFTRLGYLCHHWLHHRPSIAILAMAFCCWISCIIHTYVFNTIFWLSFRTAESKGWDVYGGAVLFSSWLAFDMLILCHFFRMDCSTKRLRPHVWSLWDSFYYAYKILLMIVLFLLFNVTEALTGSVQYPCVAEGSGPV